MSRYELHVQEKSEKNFEFWVIDLGDGGDEVDRGEGFTTEFKAVDAGHEVINNLLGQGLD